MAKTFVTVEVTKAERKALDTAFTDREKVSDMKERADELEYQAEELRDEAYRLEDESDDELQATVDEVQERLWKAAEAEAAKLNKAEKDPKYEYVVEDGKDGRIPMPDGYEVVTMPVVKRVKKYDRLGEMAAELRKAGFTVTKPKAKKSKSEPVYGPHGDRLS